MYTEFAKKKVFEQLTLTVACSASCHHVSGESFTQRFDSYTFTKKVAFWQELHFGESFTLRKPPPMMG